MLYFANTFKAILSSCTPYLTDDLPGLVGVHVQEEHSIVALLTLRGGEGRGGEGRGGEGKGRGGEGRRGETMWIMLGRSKANLTSEHCKLSQFFVYHLYWTSTNVGCAIEEHADGFHYGCGSLIMHTT